MPNMREEFQRNFDFCENEPKLSISFGREISCAEGYQFIDTCEFNFILNKNKSMSEVDAVNILNRICEVIPPAIKTQAQFGLITLKALICCGMN